LEDGPFSEGKSKEISDKYVAVRLTGGDDITPEVREFMTRYGVRGYPTLYVMNADGHLVVSRVGRSVDAMLQALADGEQSEKELAEAKKKTDPEGKKALAGLLKDRLAWSDLAAMQQSDLKSAPSAGAYGELARTYALAGRAADERATLEKAVSLYPDAKERIAWRIRLATMGVDFTKAASRDEYVKLNDEAVKALDGLLAKLVEEKDAAGAATVHATMGNMLVSAGKADDAEKHFDAALAADAKGAAAPSAMMGKANCAWSRKDYAACKATLEKLIAEFPASEEAKRAPKGIENCDKKLESEKK
jgi:hypothetical protein